MLRTAILGGSAALLLASLPVLLPPNLSYAETNSAVLDTPRNTPGATIELGPITVGPLVRDRFGESTPLPAYVATEAALGRGRLRPRREEGVRGRGQPVAGPTEISVRLSEWKVELSATAVRTGPVRFVVTNAGSIPHAFEVEGKGIEKEIEMIQPGSVDTLTLTLKAGTYEVYCPIGGDSHKKLGMESHLTITAQTEKMGKTEETGEYEKPGEYGKPASMSMGDEHASAMTSGHGMTMGTVKAIAVQGGGAVIQILPGPFPFPDSAAPILKAFGPEKEGLESQVKNGPYSDNVKTIAGTFAIKAWDLGAVKDSVDGTATFTTADGNHWKLVLDRVQTKDVAHHPRFGGVIMGLYYHGVTQVHTPLVPTINSRVALWAIGHLYKNDQLVTDNAMTHVMLLSRTRKPGSWALACWDCSKNPIEELQLQVLPKPGDPDFDAPGGFLFVNWEKSTATTPAT